MTDGAREQLEVDVAIVGGGPAGLAAAIHLVHEARKNGRSAPSIAVLEKGAEFGAHSLSGAVMDPRGLDALVPGWRERGAPVEAAVVEESLLLLSRSRSLRSPFTPPAMRHHRGVVVSLQRLVAWMAAQAEALEVDLFPGFAAAALLRDGERVTGVRTGDRGVDRKGRRKGNFEAGYDVLARITLIADGVRGNLSQQLIRDHELDRGKNPFIYAAGVKEVWRLPAERVRAGRVWHMLGWPLRSDTFGGAWLYEMRDGLVSLGLVVGLDSPDPRLNPHERLQELKTHRFFRERLAGGEITAYGAKALPEGGYWAVPRLAVDGALLLGDAAGLVNVMRLKGIHLAIESGIAAAETVAEALAADDCSASRLSTYERRVLDGPIGRELYTGRNFRQPYQSGLLVGALHTTLQLLTGGRGLSARAPAEEDHRRKRTLAAYRRPPVSAPPWDGKYILDRMSDLHFSGVRHEENQPAHLVVLDPELCRGRCVSEYGNPCTAFCPAGVYEMVAAPSGGTQLQINFSNCVHCKVCDIADPYGIIRWTPPEGGTGPDTKALDEGARREWTRAAYLGRVDAAASPGCRPPGDREADREGTVANSQGPRAHSRMGKRLFVGNLPFSATAEEIRSLFSQHGEVVDVHLVLDRETSRPRGFGFVSFATDEQAAKATQALNGHMVGGRPLVVKDARDRGAPGAPTTDRGPRGPFRPGGPPRGGADFGGARPWSPRGPRVAMLPGPSDAPPEAERRRAAVKPKRRETAEGGDRSPKLRLRDEEEQRAGHWRQWIDEYDDTEGGGEDEQGDAAPTPDESPPVVSSPEEAPTEESPPEEKKS